MAIEGKYLPIGTVVKLKDEKLEFMIISFNVTVQGFIIDKDGEKKDGTGTIFDYGACKYPAGVIRSDRLIGFNHDEIEKIVFKGYTTKDSKKISDYLNSLESKDKKEDK